MPPRYSSLFRQPTGQNQCVFCKIEAARGLKNRRPYSYSDDGSVRIQEGEVTDEEGGDKAEDKPAADEKKEPAGDDAVSEAPTDADPAEEPAPAPKKDEGTKGGSKSLPGLIKNNPKYAALGGLAAVGAIGAVVGGTVAVKRHSKKKKDAKAKKDQADRYAKAPVHDLRRTKEIGEHKPTTKDIKKPSTSKKPTAATKPSTTKPTVPKDKKLITGAGPAKKKFY